MSLAELPELIGFFSYAREDDSGSGGRLTRLRERIHEELRSQLGRRRGNFRVWQDKAAIAEGTLWSEEIRIAIDQSVFFIPIITPTAIKSEYCKAEFEHFLAREKELDRNDLVFPVLYIRVPELEDESQWRQNPVLRIVGERQYLNWLDYRHLDIDSREVGVTIERFCRSIHDALSRPGLTKQSEFSGKASYQNDDELAQKRKEWEARTYKAEQLNEGLSYYRATILRMAAFICFLIALSYFIYRHIADSTVLSLFGLLGWGAVMICWAFIAALLLGASSIVQEIIETKAEIRRLGE